MSICSPVHSAAVKPDTSATSIERKDMLSLHENIQAEDNPTESRTEDHLNRAPRLPCQHIQVARKCNSWQKVGEEDIDSRSDDELIEDRPV